MIFTYHSEASLVPPKLFTPLQIGFVIFFCHKEIDAKAAIKVLVKFTTVRHNQKKSKKRIVKPSTSKIQTQTLRQIQQKSRIH